MDQASPGTGPGPPRDSLQEAETSRALEVEEAFSRARRGLEKDCLEEDLALLREQAMMEDWTRAQGAETPADLEVRRFGVEAALGSVVGAYEREMVRLTCLRNTRDSVSSHKRAEWKGPIEELKAKTAALRETCDRVIRGAEVDLNTYRRRMETAWDLGKQDRRRGDPQPQAARGRAARRPSLPECGEKRSVRADSAGPNHRQQGGGEPVTSPAQTVPLRRPQSESRGSQEARPGVTRKTQGRSPQPPCRTPGRDRSPIAACRPGKPAGAATGKPVAKPATSAQPARCCGEAGGGKQRSVAVLCIKKIQESYLEVGLPPQQGLPSAEAADGSPGAPSPEGASSAAAILPKPGMSRDMSGKGKAFPCVPGAEEGGATVPAAGPCVAGEPGAGQEGAGGQQEVASGTVSEVSAGHVGGGEKEVTGEEMTSQSSIPLAQAPGRDWADSEMGTLTGSSQAVAFIRSLEGEGPVGVPKSPAAPITRKYVGVGHPPAVVGAAGPPPVQSPADQGSPPPGEGGSGSKAPVKPPPPKQALSYAGAVRGGEGGAQEVRSRGLPAITRGGPMPGPGGSRQHVARFRYTGEGRGPDRREVVQAVLDTGIKWSEIYALVHPGGGAEYGISFMSPAPLERFLNTYLGRVREGVWKDLKLEAASRPREDIRPILIQTLNEFIPEQDVLTWLGRFGAVEGNVLHKVRDEWGIWTGAWRARIKLHVNGGVITHLPASTFLGRDRITVSCPGQPRACFRCGSLSHLSAECTSPRCVRCGGEGHLAGGCSSIRCNLCGALGHPYSRCPAAYRESGAAEAPNPGPGPAAPSGPTTSDPSVPPGAGGKKAKAKVKHLGPVQEEEAGQLEVVPKQGGKPPPLGGGDGQGPQTHAGVEEMEVPAPPVPGGRETRESGGGAPKRQREVRAQSLSDASSGGEEEDGMEVAEKEPPEWELAKKKRKARRARPKGEAPQAELGVAIPTEGRPLVTSSGRFDVLAPAPISGVEGAGVAS